MTNREWLFTLDDTQFAKHIDISCNCCISGNSKFCGYRDCVKGIEEWLKVEHEGADNELQNISNENNGAAAES